MWSLVDPSEVPELVDLWGEEFDEAYRAAERDGRVVRAGAGPRPVGPDDAHPGPDRQRLDDVQGRLQPHVQPDRRARQRRAPVEPVHRDRRGEQRRRDRRVQPRLGQPRPPPHRRRHRRRLGAAARHRAHRRDLPRPGHRHQLLPERGGRAVQPALAPGRAGLHGPAGRAVRPADAVRLARRRSSCRPRIAEEVWLSALERSAELAEEHGRAPGVRLDPGGARGAAPRPLRRRADPDRSVGLPCGRRSPAPGCATRCSSRSPRRRPSRRSPAATSASSRRSPTCSSARRCRGSSSRSTPRSCAS